MNSDRAVDPTSLKIEKPTNATSTPVARKPRAWTSVVGAAGLLGALLAAGIIPRMQHAQVLHADEKEAASAPSGVTVATPIHATGDADLTLPGSIEPIEQAAVNARTSGYVQRWYVDIGARVKAGQLLATIQSPEVDQQVAEAQADVAKAQANLDQSKANVGTLRAAVEQARADAARYEAAISQAKADSSKAEANYQGARADAQRAQAGVTFGKAEVSKTGANLGQAKAALARQQAAVAQARQGLAEKKAAQAKAQTDVEIARKTWERWKQLVDAGAVSGQEADEKKALYDGRVSDLQAAQAAVSSSEANIEAAQAAVEASRSDVEAAQASIGSSEANVQAAEAGVNSGSANVDAVQASVQSSQANIEAAKASWRSSLASIRAAQQRVDAASSEVRSAEAAVRSARANVQRFTVLQSFQQVTAPFDGVVTARNVDTGTLVTAGAGPAVTSGKGDNTPTSSTLRAGLFGIARSDVLRIQVNVPQTFLREIKTGQRASVLIREYPQREFTGQVARIAGALDPSSRTMLVEVRLPNPNALLVPGMYAQVKLAPAGANRALRVPATTLMIDAEGTRVAVVTADHKVQFRKVELGQDFGTEVEVRNGLRGDEELIESPGDELVEGMPVKVVTHEETAVEEKH